jgi:hypothetical protein
VGYGERQGGQSDEGLGVWEEKEVGEDEVLVVREVGELVVREVGELVVREVGELMVREGEEVVKVVEGLGGEEEGEGEVLRWEMWWWDREDSVQDGWMGREKMQREGRWERVVGEVRVDFRMVALMGGGLWRCPRLGERRGHRQRFCQGEGE